MATHLRSYVDNESHACGSHLAGPAVPKGREAEVTCRYCRRLLQGNTVEVAAHSGNRKPWRALVRGADGKLLGRTGFCATEAAARRAGEALSRKHSL